MRNALKWIGITLGGLIALALVAGLVLGLVGRSRLNGRYQATATLPSEAIAAASAERGARIVTTRLCTECHGQGLTGKVFLDIPPGLIVAPNLTKGRGGVGARYATADDWSRAIRYGIRPDGSVLLPFMPVEYYTRLSDVDAASVAAYLASLPEVANELPAPKLRPPGYIMMGLPNASPTARLEEFQKPHATPPPAQTVEYGRYLAATTCVPCHAENMLGGPHVDPAGKAAPGLSHTAAWSRDDFVRAVRTGIAPGNRQLTDWMPWKAYAAFTDEEMTALYEYVKTLERPASAN